MCLRNTQGGQCGWCGMSKGEGGGSEIRDVHGPRTLPYRPLSKQTTLTFILNKTGSHWRVSNRNDIMPMYTVLFLT